MYQGELQNRVTQAVGGYLEGMDRRGELVPGAAESLFQQVLAVRHRGPEEGLNYLTQLLETRCRHFWNPECQQTEVEAPLRSVLRRMPVKDGRADTLYDELATRYGGMPPAQMAGAIWSFLNRAENQDHLNYAPQLEAKERAARALEDKTREAIEVCKEWIAPSVDLDALAAEWAGVVGQRSFYDAVQLVGDRLRMPHFAANLTPDGKPAKIAVERLVHDLKMAAQAARPSPQRGGSARPVAGLTAAQQKTQEHIRRTIGTGI